MAFRMRPPYTVPNANCHSGMVESDTRYTTNTTPANTDIAERDYVDVRIAGGPLTAAELVTLTNGTKTNPVVADRPTTPTVFAGLTIIDSTDSANIETFRVASNVAPVLVDTDEAGNTVYRFFLEVDGLKFGRVRLFLLPGLGDGEQ